VKVNPLCPTRMIGRVQIVDLIPRLHGREGRAWLEVMERHFFQSHQRAVVLNLSNSIKADGTLLRQLMYYMQRSMKRAFYSQDPNRAREIVPDYINHHMPILTREEEIVKYFGLDLMERHRDVVPSRERRKYKRFKAVMPCEIVSKDKTRAFTTKAIVTNISEGGGFVQYLNLEASMEIATLAEKPKVPIELILKHPHSSECELVKGFLIRVVLVGQQRGVAIRFVPSLTSESLLVRRFKGEVIKTQAQPEGDKARGEIRKEE